MSNVLTSQTWPLALGLGLTAVAVCGVWTLERQPAASDAVVGETAPRAEPPGVAPAAVVVDSREANGLPPDDAARRYKVPVTSSQPSLGPGDALVTIVYWNGFLDPNVRAAEAPLQETLKRYGDDVRLVHRSLPESDRQISLYVFGQAAQSQGETFWQVRAAMLQLPEDIVPRPEDLEPMAKAHGVDLQRMLASTHPHLLHTQVDARLGKQFGVEEATFFVNGRRLLLGDPASLVFRLTRLIDEERKLAAARVAGGVSRGAIYDQTVQAGYWAINDDPELRKERAAQNVTP